MQKELYTINKKDLFDLFGRLSERYSVFVPYLKPSPCVQGMDKGERLFFDEFDPEKVDSIEVGAIRQSQPLKSFLNPSRETILNNLRQSAKPVIIAGVKGCDLQSLILQDSVFKQGDFEDPNYIMHRDNTLLIGNDCTYAKETCFCLAMEGAPYPKKHFDINLSTIDDYFLAEIGSEKGRSLINSYKMFFKTASAADVDIREKNRERVTSQVKNFIDKRGTPDTGSVKGMVKKNYNSLEFWQDFASTCIECGACNLVCPTCHCFLLYDERLKDNLKRLRAWDSCLYKSFARVAGGANPRRHLYERLRNRFDKKFAFFPEVLSYFACTGCGRCIEACPGDIDIREVLKGLVLGKWNKPPND